MPLLSGEERVLTVFADIHYFFAAPSPRPLRHRFDKGSYLYLYQSSAQRKTRIEIANNPGTPEQDAFSGALDKIHVRHSTQFPTLCTVTVDGHSQSPAQNVPSFPPPPGTAAEWELVQDESQGLMRLHTLDIYFWTVEDANQFLDIIERNLPAAQVESDRHPYPPPPQSTISSVVQQLETVAITDPAYQNGQTRNSQAEVVANPASNYQAITPSSILPPPPPLASDPVHTGSQFASNEQHPDSASQSGPLPYNPAAPAAPEPIKHREKTPPPEDYANGTGLAAAAAAPDQGYPFSSSAAPLSPGLSSLVSSPTSPAPHATATMPGTYASPPPSTGLSFSPSVTRSSSLSNPLGVPSYTPSFLSGESTGYQHQQHPHQPRSSLGSTGSLPGPPQATTMTFAPPPTDTTAQHTSPTTMTFAPPPTEPISPPSQTQPQAQPQAQAPSYANQYPYQQGHAQTTPPPPIHPAVAIAGYSNYSYEQPGSTSSVAGSNAPADYDIHRQMYRPTEAEATSRHQKYAQEAMKNPGDRPQMFVKSAYRVENSVNRFLKKLEKRL
ncbi:uncharacterized protein BO97DRAFT_370819 [Aspergillus homomorphus CBS 101889]|uniref:RNA recognition motif-containing protein n=1 Tax=Aspergillus homomorphus (strain CBS 101889) TaxID=1450537 RepID=A0A395HV07_ASPHC|nr:hypothetical protein BO97DRAFT_370819 [Aspergillus homomorphus CBS 101889]RAL11356.1 hypothetical protein BO97DRAFT_370819 [Aspergillus homomorphus CBS 101889]